VDCFWSRFARFIRLSLDRRGCKERL
jgi:hypothetical protein